MCNAHCVLYDIKLSLACFNHEIYLLIRGCTVEIGNADCWYVSYDWFYDDEDSSDDDDDGSREYIFTFMAVMMMILLMQFKWQDDKMITNDSSVRQPI